MSMSLSFKAQVAMFPNRINQRVASLIETYRSRALGWKLSEAGGGGYLILVSDPPIPEAKRVVTRRERE